MAHSAEQTIATRYPLPDRTLPEKITPLQARAIQRALTNAGVKCQITTHVGIGGGTDRPMFLGCTAAEVVAAGSRLPSLRLNWLKVVKGEQTFCDPHFRAFSSMMLVWAGGEESAR